MIVHVTPVLKLHLKLIPSYKLQPRQVSRDKKERESTARAMATEKGLKDLLDDLDRLSYQSMEPELSIMTVWRTGAYS